MREQNDEVPIAAAACEEDALDVMDLSGATHVLPLKRWLGEQLEELNDVLVLYDRNTNPVLLTGDCAVGGGGRNLSLSRTGGRVSP